MEHSDYQRIEKAIQYLDQHTMEQPSLEEVANHIGLSPFHFQRLFKRWAGVSPKRFLQYLTVENAKRMLRESASVLDTALDVGLSGPGRLHDLFVNVEAMTPGEYKQLGRELVLEYGIHTTPFGDCLVAETGRGICRLEFIDHGNRGEVVRRLHQEWPEASLAEKDEAGLAAVRQIFFSGNDRSSEQINVLLRGTNFQIKVWQALLKIPEGTVSTYNDIARIIGRPVASRAVGNAVGRNPIGFLIPCHRVLRSTGALGGYRWGTVRKRAMLAMEAAH